MVKKSLSVVIVLIAIAGILVMTQYPFGLYDYQMYSVPYDDYNVDHIPSSGMNYECVDDGLAPDGDSSYVYVALNGEGDQFADDEYSIASIPAQSGTIGSVQVVVTARKLGAGHAFLHIGLRSGGGTTRVPDEGDVVTTAYTTFTTTFDKRPNDEPWTWSAVSSMRLMVQSYVWNEFSTSTTLRITSVYAVINYGTVTPDQQVTVTFDETKGNVEMAVVDGYTAYQMISNSYPQGSTVQLTATPYTGFKFISWSGDLESTANPAAVVANTDLQIVANFDVDSVPDPDPEVTCYICMQEGDEYTMLTEVYPGEECPPGWSNVPVNCEPTAVPGFELFALVCAVVAVCAVLAIKQKRNGEKR